ncbi:hypothetical protein BS47DRAFT_1299423, partial [Hydnum rufescens UP504]
PDHHLLEHLILQVYKGHILVAWVLTSGFSSIEAFVESRPSAERLHELGVEITQQYIGASQEAAFQVHTDDPGSMDDIFQQCVLFNRDAAIYFEVKNACQVGDFGQVEDLIPNMICIFHGGCCPNYANELLHLLQNLKYSWSPSFANMV